jgi:hypothetical protein
MFTANLFEYKIQHEERLRQAEVYRLAKSVKKSKKLNSKLISHLGELLVHSGQELLTQAEAVR